MLPPEEHVASEPHVPNHDDDEGAVVEVGSMDVGPHDEEEAFFGHVGVGAPAEAVVRGHGVGQLRPQRPDAHADCERDAQGQQQSPIGPALTLCLAGQYFYAINLEEA